MKLKLKTEFSTNRNESFKAKSSKFQETFSTDPNYQLLVQLRILKKKTFS